MCVCCKASHKRVGLCSSATHLGPPEASNCATDYRVYPAQMLVMSLCAFLDAGPRGVAEQGPLVPICTCGGSEPLLPQHPTFRKPRPDTNIQTSFAFPVHMDLSRDLHMQNCTEEMQSVRHQW